MTQFPDMHDAVVVSFAVSVKGVQKVVSLEILREDPDGVERWLIEAKGVLYADLTCVGYVDGEETVYALDGHLSAGAQAAIDRWADLGCDRPAELMHVKLNSGTELELGCEVLSIRRVSVE